MRSVRFARSLAAVGAWLLWMNLPVDVLILRDPRESVKKCSLTPLRGMSGVRFVSYDRDRRLDAGGKVLLHPEGEVIGERDRGMPLIVVDCAWRRVDRLIATVDGEWVRRRLPPLVTAYPRRSRVFADPERGLASVEALYAALVLMGEVRLELLAGYRWGGEFLRLNPGLGR